MRVFVTGVSGQLGHDMVNELHKRGYEVTGSDRQEIYSGVKDGSFAETGPYVSLDITDKEAVSRVLLTLKPDCIVHAAAWTNVDGAEDEENRETVQNVNVKGTEYIAECAGKLNAKIIYLSTDYVFNGEGTLPWEPDSKDFSPLNVYGYTKLMGERAVENNTKSFFIVRIAWVFGRNGKNFIRTMLKVGKTHQSVRVVNDQIGTPTYTLDLSVLLSDMLETEKYGYYHVTNEGGYISWYDFTKEIYRQAGLTTEVIPVSTEEYGLSKAKRPYNSRLSKKKLVSEGFRPLPDWKDALKRFLHDIEGEY